MNIVFYFLLFPYDLFGDIISSTHVMQYSEVAGRANGIVRHEAVGS